MGLFADLLARYVPGSELSVTMFPPDSLFESSRDLPDLSDKVLMVTGGNTGIGYETVKALLEKKAKVYLAARSADKANDAIERLFVATGQRAIFLSLDLSDMNSVRTGAEEFLKKEDRLDVLFASAGVMVCPTDQLSAQGYDLQFATNVIGHFYLEKLLLPGFAASHAKHGVPARVINTSSAGHMFAPTGGLAPASLIGGAERDAWLKATGFTADWQLYGQSKLGNIIISNYLDREHHDILVSGAVHPGSIRSELARSKGTELLRNIVMTIMGFPTHMGAWTQLYAGLVAQPEDVSGKYWIPWCRIGTPSKLARDPALEKQFMAEITQAVYDFEKGQI